MWLFTCLQLVTADLFLSSYDDKIRVTTVFGTGRAATTDSRGLIGEINTPIDLIFDATENYLYITDKAGGGLIRKLVVANSPSAFTTDLPSLYSVKTIFQGVNFNYCEYLARGYSTLYVSSTAFNVKALAFASEGNNAYKGSVLAGSRGDTTCKFTCMCCATGAMILIKCRYW